MRVAYGVIVCPSVFQFEKIINVGFVVWYLVASVVEAFCRSEQFHRRQPVGSQWLQLLWLGDWFCVELECLASVSANIRIIPHETSTSKEYLQMVVRLGPHLIV